MISCQLIIDLPGEGAWNMALDEALLESAEHHNAAWLRFYTWREPTLSLGYFQRHTDRQSHPASANCPMVRRSSGGGAILHDHELTYSIGLPHAHPLARRPESLYQAAHKTLIETLAELGIIATLCCGTQATSLSEPFLCFQRHLPGDLLVGSHKVAGSAQRRHRGGVLQHGSVLLSRSRFASELPGIADLATSDIKVDQLRELWQKRLSQRAEFDLQPTMPSENVLSKATEISRLKFSTPQWTFRR